MAEYYDRFKEEPCENCTCCSIADCDDGDLCPRDCPC